MSKTSWKRYKRIAYKTCLIESLHDANHEHFKTLTNERTINRTVDNTFDEIDSFSKLINIFVIFRQEKYNEPCNI